MLLRVCVFLLLVCLFGPDDGQAQDAGVTIAPKRVVFEGRARATEVTLINQGSGPGIYRIDLIDLAMTEEGGLTELPPDRPGPHSAKALLRFSPREVAIAPGQSQTIRVMVRKPAALAAGEYRSHLRIQAVPPPDALNNVEPVPIGDTGIAVKLLPIFGQSIPIIVREGKLAAEVAIAKAALSKGPQGPILDLLFRRTGDRSVYGDISVRFDDGSGEPVEVGVARGISCYPPSQQRPFRVSLTPPEGTRLSRGSLLITYREPDEAGGAVLAETSLKL